VISICAASKITTNKPADNTILNALLVDMLTSFLVDFVNSLGLTLFEISLLICPVFIFSPPFFSYPSIILFGLLGYSVLIIVNNTVGHTSLFGGSWFSGEVFTYSSLGLPIAHQSIINYPLQIGFGIK
jgi:hypothetical protein